MSYRRLDGLLKEDVAEIFLSQKDRQRSMREHLEASNGERNWKLYLESRYKCTTCCVQSDEVGKHDSS